LIDQDSTSEPLTAPKSQAMHLYVLAAKADDPAAEQFALNFHPVQALKGTDPASMEKKLQEIVAVFEQDHPDSISLTEFDIPPGKEEK
jgi:hypothetical protein